MSTETDYDDFPHADVIDPRELEGMDFSPEIAAEIEDARGYAPDWQYGASLIADSYFVEYAQELAEDIGAIPKDLGWPLYSIDWEAAARGLKMDYSSVTIDGREYWTRS